MHRPGATVNVHLWDINVGLASANMLPQVGVGGGTPTPKKLSEASKMTATPTVKLNRTMAVLVTFGRMCLNMMRIGLTPFTSASLTKSRSRRLSTSPQAYFHGL